MQATDVAVGTPLSHLLPSAQAPPVASVQDVVQGCASAAGARSVTRRTSSRRVMIAGEEVAQEDDILDPTGSSPARFLHPPPTRPPASAQRPRRAEQDKGPAEVRYAIL